MLWKLRQDVFRWHLIRQFGDCALGFRYHIIGVWTRIISWVLASLAYDLSSTLGLLTRQDIQNQTRQYGHWAILSFQALDSFIDKWILDTFNELVRRQ